MVVNNSFYFFILLHRSGAKLCMLLLSTLWRVISSGCSVKASTCTRSSSWPSCRARSCSLVAVLLDGVSIPRSFTLGLCFYLVGLHSPPDFDFGYSKINILKIRKLKSVGGGRSTIAVETIAV